MDSRLQNLLARISPEHTLDSLDARIDDALNSFTLRVARLATWDEFTAAVEAFLRHLHDVGLGLGVGFDHGPAGSDWSRCDHYLRQIYGPSGAAVAFRMAQGGTEGGLRRVLSDFARHLARQWADQEIAVLVAQYVKPLTPDECFSAARAYLAEYGRFLPRELQTGALPILVIQFEQVLRQHPHIIQQLRRASR